MNDRLRLLQAIGSILLALTAMPLHPADGDEPVRCVSLKRIDRTEVIDDRTIVFHMKGGDIYVNQFDRACPNLDRNRAFSYRTSTGQICSVDSITVLENFGFGLRRGASCGLNEFVPADEEHVEMLKGEQEPADVTVEEIDVPD